MKIRHKVLLVCLAVSIAWALAPTAYKEEQRVVDGIDEAYTDVIDWIGPMEIGLSGITKSKEWK